MQPQFIEPSTVIDWTQIIMAVVTTLIPVVGGIATYLINKHIKDKQLRDVLENALNNGLGIIQQVSSGVSYKTSTNLKGVVSDKLVPGVRYVQDHASNAVARWKLTPNDIAEKLVARAGVNEIKTNLAATSSASSPVVVPPLTPSSPVTEKELPNRDELNPKSEVAVVGVVPASECPPTAPKS